jgi:hypothetical protein
VIKKLEPFEYVVTLKAIIENESREIRRWDNIGKEEHMDVFYLKRKPKKHQSPSVKGILNLYDLERLLECIDRNYRRYIETYKK